MKAGRRLADLHINYEKQSEYPLQKIEKAGETLDWRVEKMRLSEQYIVRLIGQVITVSLETMKLVKTLPGLGFFAEAQVAATAT